MFVRPSFELPISFFAVEHTLDLEVIGVLTKEDAMILGAQADHGRRDAFELFGRTLAAENMGKCGRRKLNPRESLSGQQYSFHMPAFPRLAIPGLPYHVTQRGNYRQDVFDTAEDREVYLGYVAGAAIAYGLELHGGCLMTNHVHWIVLPQDQTAMTQTFRRAHSCFSAYVNRLRRRSGRHLWQGRYYSCPLDDQRLFSALLYVERNPERAGLVRSATEYE